jgi:ATP-dependent 26S proteasome regulatory subunit
MSKGVEEMPSDKENKDKDKNKDKKYKNKDKDKNKSKNPTESAAPKTAREDTDDKIETLEKLAPIVSEVRETIESKGATESKSETEATLSSVSTGVTGTGPTYFFTQSNTLPPIDIPPDIQTTILTLPVFTTQTNQRVKIDAFFQLIIESIINASSFAYTFNIELYRNSSSIVSIDVVANGYSKPVSIGVFRELPTLTWTDIPPTIGLQKYEIRVRRITFGNENHIDSVSVFTRALNAIVFP